VYPHGPLLFLKALEKKMKLSVCMITKNECAKLEQCLKRLSTLPFEIIVVDTGSSDNSKEVAAKYANSVYEYPWTEDFSAARNFSVQKASNDYVLIIDSDEVITYIDLNEMERLIRKYPAGIGRIEMVSPFTRDHEDMESSERVSRLFNHKMYRYTGRVHEQLVPIDAHMGQPHIYDTPLTISHSGYGGTPEQVRNKANRNINLLKEELQDNSKDSYVLYQLGKSYFMKQDAKTACEYFEKALALDVDEKLEYVNDLVVSYGYALLNTKQYEKALQFENIFDTFGNTADFVFLMGLIYMNNAKFSQAIKAFLLATERKQCMVMGANSFRALYNVGVIYECLGFKEEAIHYYELCKDYINAKQRYDILINE
jgi:glycosyltransferase involved in cell wall biosynthesis